jgi:pyridoxine 5-phosphate synthase
MDHCMQPHPILLGVNIDHVATLRQARYRDNAAISGGYVEPDPLFAALLAEQSGADSITVHPREDQRHIQRKDLFRIKSSLRTRLNMEMACTGQMTGFALEIKPHSVCLVPENREEVTTEGGLDVVGQFERVREVVEAMNAEGILVSLFIDPSEDQIDLAAELKVAMVELHTGAFSRHFDDIRGDFELEKLVDAARYAHEAGLIVNAGHGINYHNIRKILRIPHLYELNIGHSIISRALMTGMAEAVAEMKRRMNPGFN